MLKKILLLLGFFVLLANVIMAQANLHKTIEAKRTTQKIKIDGILDEAAWKEGAELSNFTEYKPHYGQQEVYENRTQAYLMYNDEGVLFGGYCFEKKLDSMSTELTGRDGFGANDFIEIVLDTYNDKLNGFQYLLTPLNEQWDAKIAPPGPNTDQEDFTWNAVWQSATQLRNDGWSFEIFIPYASIRFSKNDLQDWGINIFRKRRKSGREITWNPVNPNVNGFLTQSGVWKGLSKIKPPLRLQFSPYISTYVNHFPNGKNSWTSSVNGGMDVKYGISQAITLDMTLIPDFGQIQSDNKVLNLTPFEVRFNENRSFFTEGTDLFSKGGYFYSRRIGGTPLLYDEVGNSLQPNEYIVKNPLEARILNATKISGRLQNGLGIGFLNAITAQQSAIIADGANNQRKMITSPLTNYNIVVLNQSLKNNSSVSLINTNVTRSGKFYDANVTSAMFNLYDKKNRWNGGGRFAVSSLSGYLPNGKSQNGYTHSLYFGKASGKFTFNVNQVLMNDKFDINDLGYLNFNNFLKHNIEMGYRWLTPTSWYNNISLYADVQHQTRLLPKAFRGANYNFTINSQLKNLWFLNTFFGYEPKGNDFNEPRQPGRVFKGWSNFYVGGSLSTNEVKKYSISLNYLWVDRSLFNSKRTEITFTQLYRFNKKMSVLYSLALEPQTNNVGYAGATTNDIIFGRRNRNTVENILSIKYNFTNKSWITTRVRHYWSKVDYKQYYTLLNNGYLQPNMTYAQNKNQNFNLFNIDMVYNWQFAPGSFVTFVWKNAIQDFKNSIEKNYFKNINQTLEADQNNNLSIKIIYFLDYREVFKRNK